MGVDAVLLLRLAYLTAAALVLLVFAISPFRSRFLQYGPRSSTPNKKKGNEKNKSNAFIALLDSSAQICVPHSWFASFYAVSVLCSLYWAPEILIKGPAFQAISAASSASSHSMTFHQVMITWLMMLAQGGRRVYECLALSKPSLSQMWVGHWALGIFFYIATSIAIWIEGIPSIQQHKFSFRDLMLGSPDIRTFFGLLLFMLASGLQHDCHAYLASLKSSEKGESHAGKTAYRLPEHPAFNISLTPHYFAECLIYLSLAVVAAPRGDWLNWSLASALVFVVVNLGVTAHGTKLWYEAKFGVDKVKGKARMLPLLY